MTTPVVVDISHYQPQPDFKAMKAGGVVGVIIKATEGTSITDSKWKAYTEGAFAAGLKVGAYHFLRPGSMTAQVDHFLDCIDMLLPLGSRVAIDHEDSKVSLAELEDCIEYLHKKRPDLQIALYSGHLIKEQLGNKRSDTLARLTSLWIAQYNDTGPSWPTGTWVTWSLWQYTDRATVPGISAPVDGDEWNGDSDGLLRWFGPVSNVPEPEPAKPQVELRIKCPEGVELLIYVNDDKLPFAALHVH